MLDSDLGVVAPAQPSAWSRELLALLATARSEITAHGNDQGLCSVCGSAFPCERAELAAFALDAL